MFLPAFSISESRRASVIRAGGRVSSASACTSEAATATPSTSFCARRERRQRRARPPPRRSRGSTARQPGSISARARVRKLLARHLGDALHALPDARAGGRRRGSGAPPGRRRAVVAAELAARQHAGRDDREVVRDAGVVEDAAAVLEAGARADGVRRARSRKGRARRAPRELLEHLVHHGAVVVGQAARVGARIGQELVRLVAALRARRACGAPTSRSGGSPSRWRQVRSKSGGADSRDGLRVSPASAWLARRGRDDRRARAPRRRCGRPCAGRPRPPRRRDRTRLPV